MKHSDWLRTFGCIICDNPHVEIAHQRYSQYPKVNPGMGRRDHRYMLPVCHDHHVEQHKGNELAFWQRYGIEPLGLSEALWRASGDLDATLAIIKTARLRRAVAPSAGIP